MTIDEQTSKDPSDPKRERAEERPLYEPPRIEKKRSVSRATLFTGSGPAVGGPGLPSTG